MTAFRSGPRAASTRYLFGLAATALFVLSACDSSKPAPASAPAPVSAPASASPLETEPTPTAATTDQQSPTSIACPSQELKAFIVAFAEDPALQKAFTADVVDTAFIDWNAQPEPTESSEPLPREKLHFPVMPNRAQQSKEGLQYREISADDKSATVVLEVPDTDAQLRYTFRHDQCWTLVKIVDPAFGKAFPGEAPPPG